jgi:putative acetyltransferase
VDDPVDVVQADTPARVEIARELFLEYADWLAIDLRFQGFDKELATLPGDYAPPGGRLLLVLADDGPAGCVALRPLAADTAELKRLYVRENWRGRGGVAGGWSNGSSTRCGTLAMPAFGSIRCRP